jgi:transcriptional repressor NrdR
MPSSGVKLENTQYMHCLFCKNKSTEVIETRLSEDGTTIRRRRQCTECKKRFTTYEKVEELPILVIKKDKRRERFDREKLRKGIITAVGKTTVTAKQVQDIIDEVESFAKIQESTEVDSKKIGDIVAEKLKNFDKVAYIRFASVFRRFVDVEEFEKELKKLL